MTSAVGASTRRTAARVLRERPWLAALLVYAASRLYSTGLLLGVFLTATATGLPFASIRTHPTFFTFSGSWDGWFYRSIAEHGYPVALPLDATGQVLPNPWAFLPVFPALERAVTSVTGLTTYTAGALVATAAGAVAAIALQRLLAPQVGDRRAIAAVALFCFGPTGFLLQVAYADSLFLLLVFAAVIALQRGNLPAFAALGCLAAFTRPGGTALVLALVLQTAVTWRADRRRPADLGPRVAAAAVVTAAALAWPVVADLATGRPGAYVDTELSWWTGWVGRPPFVPFTPWALLAWRWTGGGGLLLAIVMLAAVAVWLVRGSPRRLDAATRSFTLAWAVVLLAVFLPQVSLPRLLMPAAPLLGAAAFTGTPRRALAWLAAGVALQPIGVVLLWFLGYP